MFFVPFKGAENNIASAIESSEFDGYVMAVYGDSDGLRFCFSC